MDSDAATPPIFDMYKNLEEKLIDSIASRSYEWHEAEDLKTDAQDEQWTIVGPELEEAIPLVDEEDVAILLEREAHFSGNFAAMISYYQNEEHKGIFEEISYGRILRLADLEKKLGRDIAPLVLRGADAERLMKSKKMYAELAQLLASYEDTREQQGIQKEAVPPSIALVECILSEDPIDVLVDRYKEHFKGHSSLLHTIVSSHELYDRLYPGYGLAPIFAIKLIGELRDTSAVDLLFNQLFQAADEREDVNEAILSSLRMIGEKAKEKALAILSQKQGDRDRERAIHVLVEFLPDPEIAEYALREIIQNDTHSPSEQSLQYLTLLLEGLPEDKLPLLEEWLSSHRSQLSHESSSEIEYMICRIRRRQEKRDS